MGQCYITRRGTKTGNTTEQLGVYPTGNDGRPMGNVTVLDNVTTLSSHLFQDNANVLNVYLPNKLYSIDPKSFQNCTSLQEIDIPNRISIIPTNCFENDTSLSKVKLPLNLLEIKEYAFSGCTKLFDIEINENISDSLNIESYAFKNCKLDNETVTKLATRVKGTVYAYSFAGLSEITNVSTYKVNSYYFNECSNLQRCTILNPLVNGGFGEKVFEGCLKINTVILPDNATIINQKMFYNLPSLKNVNIPEDCITIGEQSFYNCTGLTEIYLWDKIETIANNAFQNCTNLKSIYIDKLRGSIAEPANRWGATNATVYYNNPKIKIINLSSGITVYINGQNTKDEYEVPMLGNIVCTAYHKDYLPSVTIIEANTTNHTYAYEPIMSNQDGYRLTLNVSNNSPKYSISYDEVHTFTDNSVLVPKGTEVNYAVSAFQSESKKGTITITEDTVLDFNLNPQYWESITLQYPFTDYTWSNIDYLSELNQFEVSGTYISNKTTSHSNASYGYIKFKTPTAENYTEELYLKVSCYVSSENNCDFGAIWVGTEIWNPTQSNIKNNTAHNNGQWLFRGSGTSISSPQEYTMLLNPDTEYYINLAYAKDSSSVDGSDKIFISKIDFVAAV